MKLARLGILGEDVQLGLVQLAITDAPRDGIDFRHVAIIDGKFIPFSFAVDKSFVMQALGRMLRRCRQGRHI